MADCNNNCEAVAGLNEAAANLIQYSKLINSWLNGGANQTVNVGGTNIPTLLGLACEIRQLVGVWPDGLTIKIDPTNKKIYVPLKTNGGVHVGNQGLYIDSSDFLQLGGGLAKDSNGNIFVDFDQMPTTKFDSILETFRKGLRLPKWLTANTNFYVDKNHAAASNVLDEGRGLSASKPFKNIQACVNYVAENYNLASFTANILVASGDYTDQGRINLPAYTTNTGKIYIKGVSGNSADVKTLGYFLNKDSSYEIWNQTLLNNYTPDNWGACAQSWGGRLDLRNVVCDLSNLDATMTSKSYGALAAINGGIIQFYAYNDDTVPTGVTIKNTGDFVPSFLMRVSNKGTITMAADLNGGSDLVFSTFITVETGGLFSRALSGFINPGRAAQFNRGSFSYTGKRYAVGALSQISGVGGPYFFPGTTDGTKDDLGAYS